MSSDRVDVAMLSSDEVSQGKDSFVLEFRERGTSTLVAVSAVRVAAMMPMTGMAPMFGGVDLEPSVPGRYSVATDLGMAGGWQFQIEWTDATGSHVVRMQQAVR